MVGASKRIEEFLKAAVGTAATDDCPSGLASALHYAVFPGGARIRPRLCLAVANACRIDEPVLAMTAGASIELLHCASLVHDDMPCFDNAATRRGKPSVHCAFGEQLALLAGDGLIVLAFQTLASCPSRRNDRLLKLVSLVARATGAPDGITAGQAWECEDAVELTSYHKAKTAALFAAATEAGAIAAGAPADTLAGWRMVGEKLGEAYQVADDILDAVGDADAIGKPVGQDTAFNRPSAVVEHGLRGAKERLDAIAHAAIQAVPDCPGRDELSALITMESARFLPADLAPAAA